MGMIQYDEVTVENWRNTKLLAGVPAENEASLAYLLETQRIHNELNSHWMDPKFMRISIPLCKRLFQHLLEAGVPVTSAQAPSDPKVIGTPFVVPGQSVKERFLPVADLDGEAETTAELAYRLAVRIEEWVIRHKPKTFELLGLTEHHGRIVIYYR